MNDYRENENRLRELLEEAGRAGRVVDLYWEEGYVRAGWPPDRKGLIAAFHAQCMIDDNDRIANMAKAIAKRTKQRVYTVMTMSRWYLLLFARDDGTYDGDENEYIGYHDPDGSRHFVSVS